MYCSIITPLSIPCGWKAFQVPVMILCSNPAKTTTNFPNFLKNFEVRVVTCILQYRMELRTSLFCNSILNKTFVFLLHMVIMINQKLLYGNCMDSTKKIRCKMFLKTADNKVWQLRSILQSNNFLSCILLYNCSIVHKKHWKLIHATIKYVSNIFFFRYCGTEPWWINIVIICLFSWYHEKAIHYAHVYQ